MIKTKKNAKGITLVSLVVTIIILIILAGVSINMTLGEEGLITIAKKAKENIEFAQIEEQEKLNELYSQLEGNEGITGGEIDYDAIAKLNNFKKAIADYIEEAGGIKPDYTDSAETFGEKIKGIVKEVTKDATATEEDITEGKTAWVNGNKIQGTKIDKSSEITSNFAVTNNGIYYEIANLENYKKLSITVSSTDSYNSAWDSSQLGIYGDGIEIGRIKDYSKHEYDISSYSTIKIAGIYLGGAGRFPTIYGTAIIL